MTPARSGRAALGSIRSRQTFADLRKRAERGRAGPISIRFVAEPEWKRSEVAFAVGRQVGSAVVRNRLRRQMRAVLAEQAGGLPRGAYLVRCAPGGPSLTFEQLKEAMSNALEKATAPRGKNPGAAT